MILSWAGLIVALVLMFVAWGSWAAGREYGDQAGFYRGYEKGWLDANDTVVQHVYYDEGTDEEKN